MEADELQLLVAEAHSRALLLPTVRQLTGQLPYTKTKLLSQFGRDIGVDYSQQERIFGCAGAHAQADVLASKCPPSCSKNNEPIRRVFNSLLFLTFCMSVECAIISYKDGDSLGSGGATSSAERQTADASAHRKAVSVCAVRSERLLGWRSDSSSASQQVLCRTTTPRRAPDC